MAGMVPYSNYEQALRRAWPFGAFDDFFAPLAAVAGSDRAFRMDVEDAGDKYVVTAELPGVGKGDVDVELDEGRLSISVDKKESDEQRGRSYLHRETGEWSATRGVYLKDAATSGITAKLDGGVLTVSVPKRADKTGATRVAID
ncbi:MAG: Hsp20 family protein [Coriobacteriaceae bacterium]|nr:Hsp20 family protein [Coriobacteriaceae bacterium]MDD7583268.1 Hsp20 family protein [Coriobacteriaceae bacterium]